MFSGVFSCLRIISYSCSLGAREVPEAALGGGPIREVVLQHETEWLPSMLATPLLGSDKVGSRGMCVKEIVPPQ